MGKNQGISSNKLVKPSVRTGASREGIRAGYAGQIGTALGNHATDKGKPLTGGAVKMYSAPPAASGVKLGNELALNSKSAPGQGRTVHARGSQDMHGPAIGSPKAGGRDPFGGR